MKILDLIVKENFDFDGDDMSIKRAEVGNISVSDLNSLQLRTLNRLKDGVVDLDSASTKEVDIIMDLIELGLVNDDGQVTDSGLAALEKPSTNTNVNHTDDEVDDFSDIVGDDEEIDFSINDRF